MPTNREREYYRLGFYDGVKASKEGYGPLEAQEYSATQTYPRKKVRKLSDWQKYIKNKRNHIKYRDGKLNLKKMGVAFRRKKRR